MSPRTYIQAVAILSIASLTLPDLWAGPAVAKQISEKKETLRGRLVTLPPEPGDAGEHAPQIVLVNRTLARDEQDALQSAFEFDCSQGEGKKLAKAFLDKDLFVEVTYCIKEFEQTSGDGKVVITATTEEAEVLSFREVKTELPETLKDQSTHGWQSAAKAGEDPQFMVMDFCRLKKRGGNPFLERILHLNGDGFPEGYELVLDEKGKELEKAFEGRKEPVFVKGRVDENEGKTPRLSITYFEAYLGKVSKPKK